VLGRLAAVLAGRPRPFVVHTYHGHVLEGYFGRPTNLAYRRIERALGTVSDRLVGVSAATVDDLVRLAVAPADQFRVVPIGLELAPFLDAPDDQRRRFRSECGVGDDELLLTFVGRLVAIKRVDVALRAVAHARRSGAAVRLAIVGDGERRPQLERLAGELDIAPYVAFLGYRADVVPVAAASDIALLSSDNEGTPVSLIVAAAAGTPAVATAVGGVADVVTPRTGVLVARGDAWALGAAIARLATQPQLRVQMAREARSHVRDRFAVERLLADIDALYRELNSASVTAHRSGRHRSRLPTRS
jgi:glycosyltransferase involved in cell wall biosynthesis